MSLTTGSVLAGLRIDALRLPSSVDAPEAADLLAAAGVMTDALRHDTGTTLFDAEPAEWLVGLRATRYVDRSVRLARLGDRVVGVLEFDVPRDGERSANAGVHVSPDARGVGVEDALLDQAEALARDARRSVLYTWNLTRFDAPGERLPSPAGLGSVPLAADSTQRLLRHGYTLGQVERVSTFEFARSLSRAEDMLQAALAAAGPDYRPVWWRTPAPDAYVDGYAYAIGRMGTDVPSGELDWEPEDWDAERVRYRERLKADAGQLMAVAAVIHEPTGAVAAFNELVIGRDRTRPTQNYGTLVLPEHRGHRLGTIVKCLGLVRWHEFVPTSPRVMTFNAEENRFMLDVNEAVGFAPAAASGEWKKEL
jgi:GNAT superfamily N-acetyltransferase